MWATTKSDEEKLKRFVRKILRKFHEPIYNTEEQGWEIRSNNRINELYKRENVVQFIKDTSLERVWRADGRMTKRNGRNEEDHAGDGRTVYDDGTHAVTASRLVEHIV